jgi:hypothetical protein
MEAAMLNGCRLWHLEIPDIRRISSESVEIHADKRTLIPEKTADAGTNTFTMTALEKTARRQKYFFGTYEVDTGAKGRTSSLRESIQTADEGQSHLNSLWSPFLNSSNLLACSQKIARVDSAESHALIFEASGWLRRSILVFSEYLAKAALKIAWKLEELVLVLGVEDIIL